MLSTNTGSVGVWRRRFQIGRRAARYGGAPPSSFFVSVDSKAVVNPVSLLESTLTGCLGSIDFEGLMLVEEHENGSFCASVDSKSFTLRSGLRAAKMKKAAARLPRS